MADQKFIDTPDGPKPLSEVMEHWRNQHDKSAIEFKDHHSEPHQVSAPPPPNVPVQKRGTFIDSAIKPPARLASYKTLAALQEKQLLSGAQRGVYEILFKIGPATAGEITAEFLQEPANQHVVSPSYHKRLPELERLGVIRRLGVRSCAVTEKVCDLWDVTDQLPKESSQPITRSKTILSCGMNLSQCIRSFAEPVGWQVAEIKEGRPNKRYHWSKIVVTEAGEIFRAAGVRVPGGFVMTLWE